MADCYVPFLSEEEKIYLNTAASYSQSRRMSNASTGNLERNSLESSHSNHRQNSLFLLWKRRASSESYESCNSEDKYCSYPSAKAKELECLIFDQPQRTCCRNTIKILLYAAIFIKTKLSTRTCRRLTFSK